MTDLSEGRWEELAQAYAFIGNSLLKPMTQTDKVGLDPEFWQAFPDFGDAKVRAALRNLACFAKSALAEAENVAATKRTGSSANSDMDSREALNATGAIDSGAVGADTASSVLDEAALRVAVEYTHLFVGPPSPAAPPWETMNRCKEATVGFGEATFQMRALLREAGFALSNENRQYEDHLGIELLYLSELCRLHAKDGEGAGGAEGSEKAESAESAACAGGAESAKDVRSFIDEHPLSWVSALHEKVREAAPGGYFDKLLALTDAVLAWHRAHL